MTYAQTLAAFANIQRGEQIGSALARGQSLHNLASQLSLGYEEKVLRTDQKQKGKANDLP
jgi:hypothetical protein